MKRYKILNFNGYNKYGETDFSTNSYILAKIIQFFNGIIEIDDTKKRIYHNAFGAKVFY